MLLIYGVPDHKENYDKQDKGFSFLKVELPGFYVPNKSEKKQLLEILGISKRFQQTFDAVCMKVSDFSKIKTAKDFDLLEIKTTGKHLPALPEGFFFGMTENEEMLLKVFEGKYFLCLLSLHPKSKNFVLVDWSQLETLTQNKRVQYQINLKTKKKS